MMKNIALQNDCVFSVTITTTVPVRTRPVPSTLRSTNTVLTIFPSCIQQVKEVPDLVCYVLSALEIINIHEQQLHTIVSVKDNEANYQR
jgi:hypothetical protein